jgi:imidazolonepropionase-like amidohydrolase
MRIDLEDTTMSHTSPLPRRKAVAAFGILLAFAAAAAPASAQTVAYTGATVWDGTGAPARAGVTMVVQDGRITAVGADVAVPSGARIERLDGKFVMPGLVNAHGHVSGAWTTRPGAPEADRIRDDLLLYARYGVTSVNSLGDGTTAIRIASEPISPDAPHARLLASGPVVTASDPATARADAQRHADAGARWLKLRVDDNLGTSSPMPWEAVEAVFGVGRERGLPVATHMFYLDDALRLLELGTGMVAHSVRDVDVDQDFIARLAASDACYVPTLTRELSTFVYAERPEFFADPFFQRWALADEVRRLEDPAVQASFRSSPTAEGYRRALEQASRNLVTLHDAGIPVAFGTDTGPAGRFLGYFEHLELWMMVEAGMSSTDALRSATAVAAACSGFEDVGTLEPGRLADFLVLAADPTADIGATRTLERVFVGGVEIPR